jgi:hypothetical protein
VKAPCEGQANLKNLLKRQGGSESAAIKLVAKGIFELLFTRFFALY